MSKKRVILHGFILQDSLLICGETKCFYDCEVCKQISKVKLWIIEHIIEIKMENLQKDHK